MPPSVVFTADAGQQSYVWVVDEGSQKVTRRAVKTGKLTPVGIAVTEGLKPGEWVVIGRRAFAPRESGSEDSPGREPVAP